MTRVEALLLAAERRSPLQRARFLQVLAARRRMVSLP
jgi:hypothetical protein